KHQLQAELNLSRRGHGLRDLSRRADQGVIVRIQYLVRRVRKIRSVEKIKELRAKFQPCRFPLQGNALSQAHVEVHRPRPDQRPAAQIPIEAGGRYSKGARIKPKSWSTELLSRRHADRPAGDEGTWNSVYEGTA